MQLERYGEFPKNLPVIVEEDMFLYPFTILFQAFHADKNDPQ